MTPLQQGDVVVPRDPSTASWTRGTVYGFTETGRILIVLPTFVMRAVGAHEVRLHIRPGARIPRAAERAK